MKLITYKTIDDIELLKSEPLQPFKTDCNQCKYFYTTPFYSPSGECTKYGFSCGYGFTCEDFIDRKSK